MDEFSNSQWSLHFANTSVGSTFADFGTTVTPMEILEDALSAYNKAEKEFNNNRSEPPYLNSVSNPSTGTIIFDSDGLPLQPVTYQINLLRAFGTPKSQPQTSPTTII